MNLAQAVCDALNELLKVDRKLVTDLTVTMRVATTSRALANDRYVQVMQLAGSGRYIVGTLGFLNGIVGRVRAANPNVFEEPDNSVIAVNIDSNGEIENFEVLSLSTL